MPRPIQLQWNTPPSTIDTAVARTSRMIMAGIAAIAHLTSRTTMDQNGIFTSTTTTSLVSLIGGLVRENARVHRHDYAGRSAHAPGGLPGYPRAEEGRGEIVFGEPGVRRREDAEHGVQAGAP